MDAILNPSISESVNMMILSYFNFLMSKSGPIPQPITLTRYLNSWFANISLILAPHTFFGTPRNANSACVSGSRAFTNVPLADFPSTRNSSRQPLPFAGLKQANVFSLRLSTGRYSDFRILVISNLDLALLLTNAMAFLSTNGLSLKYFISFTQMIQQMGLNNASLEIFSLV